ncbi:hypothetical protein RSW84_26730, partial [Escherichia coli]|uniref:hypothetical protein n=1 Tax=Escherichia coli TaxID=562 RepID=UPI0028DD5846
GEDGGDDDGPTDIEVKSFNPATGAMELYGGDSLTPEEIAAYLKKEGYTDISYDGVNDEWSYKKGIATYAGVTITVTEVFKLTVNIP